MLVKSINQHSKKDDSQICYKTPASFSCVVAMNNMTDKIP